MLQLCSEVFVNSHLYDTFQLHAVQCTTLRYNVNTNLVANKRRIRYACDVDEGRKRTLAVVAAIFACRKLAALEGKTLTSASECLRRLACFSRRTHAPN